MGSSLLNRTSMMLWKMHLVNFNTFHFQLSIEAHLQL
jgi:hypothetical protein